MLVSSIVRVYLEIAALLGLGYGFLALLVYSRSQEPARWLKFAQYVFVLAFALPCITSLIPRASLFRPSLQVWSGVSRGAQRPYLILARATASAPKAQGVSFDDRWLIWLGALIACIVLIALARYGLRLSRLARALGRSIEIRRIGRVSVRISEDDLVAYSAWLHGRAHVVLPASLLAHRADFKIAVRHEIQHHRQCDTRWIHIFEFSQALYCWNPVARPWSRLIEHLQELACDEALIGRRNISPQAYGGCLLRAAQLALGTPSAAPAGTTGMAKGYSGRFLKRRIEMLFVADRKKSSKMFSGFCAVIALALMATSAFAARGLVRDRTLTLAEAKTLAAGATGGEIPITVNDLVLAQLNRFVGTPEGRERVRAGLGRMPLYRAMIERKLGAEGFPLELIAMPLQESGFRNDVISPKPYRSRGIWQFIQPTALNYGLQVDDRVDERLDPEKETDAAVHYLRDLYAQFGDWRLAMKGYNEGEKRVQAMIDKFHTRDPWELEHHDSTESYLPATIAMIIILKNPGLLE